MLLLGENLTWGVWPALGVLVAGLALVIPQREEEDLEAVFPVKPELAAVRARLLPRPQLARNGDAIAEETRLVGVLADANAVNAAFGHLKHWLTDLAVSLLMNSEREAMTASASPAATAASSAANVVPLQRVHDGVEGSASGIRDVPRWGLSKHPPKAVIRGTADHRRHRAGQERVHVQSSSRRGLRAAPAAAPQPGSGGRRAPRALPDRDRGLLRRASSGSGALHAADLCTST